MNSRSEQIKTELDRLIKSGDDVRKAVRSNDLPQMYQLWHSDALAVVRNLLPDRVEDFEALYENERQGDWIDANDFRISDVV